MGPTKERRSAEEGLYRGTLLPRGGASRAVLGPQHLRTVPAGTGTYTSEEWALLAFGSGSLDAQRVPTELGLTHLQNRHLQAALVPSRSPGISLKPAGAPEEWVLPS